MRVGFFKLIAAAGLLAGTFSLGMFRPDGVNSWVQRSNTSGAVRIVQFYASVGTVQPGGTATLCYGVQNAKSVRISPLLPGVFPAASHCLEVHPEHTTHYTILAEGYDGAVATRSLTIPVASAPPASWQPLLFARWATDAKPRALPRCGAAL